MRTRKKRKSEKWRVSGRVVQAEKTKNTAAMMEKEELLMRVSAYFVVCVCMGYIDNEARSLSEIYVLPVACGSLCV